MGDRLLRLREKYLPTVSIDAFQSTHLRIGDVVSLFALDSNANISSRHEGFLSTLGSVLPNYVFNCIPFTNQCLYSSLVDDRIVVEEKNGTLQSPPKTFRGMWGGWEGEGVFKMQNLHFHNAISSRHPFQTASSASAL